MFNLPYNAEPMSQNMPSQNVPLQSSQNNFQMFQQPQMASSQMQPSPSNICNSQDQQKHPSYQFYQGEVFRPGRQSTSNVPPPTNLCQPIFQTPYNTSPPIQIQQKPAESLPQSILDQIRACVSSVAPPIFILPGGCQSTNHQQSERMPSANQPELSHAPGQQPGGLNYPSLPPIYCPPSFYPYPIPLPVYDPPGASSAARSKVQNCDCQKFAGPTFNIKGRGGQCQCDVECSEHHHCTQTTDDTICSKLNCPSSINLQALASQLLSVPGIISCAATRLILRKIPGSNITTTMECTMDTARRSIGALTKDQLVTESRIAQQVTALINLHMNNSPPANIVPVLTLIQLKVNLLKAQVDSLINKKVMETDGYAAEVDSANPIDPMILTLKSDSELRQLQAALRQKECDERVTVNFAPYHSQRAIAEARLNRVQSKIRQVEGEFDKRRCAALPSQPITSDFVPTHSPSTANTRAKYPIVSPTNNIGFYDSPNPFAVKLQNPRRLNLKPHVGCPQTTYDNSAPVRTSVDQAVGNESRGTETQKQETEDKSNATSEEKENQTNEEGRKYEDREECIFCNRPISEGSIEQDKKKLRTTTRKAEKAIAVTSSDKLHKVEAAVSENKIAIEKDDISLTSKASKIDPGYDEVTSDSGESKVHWLSGTFDVSLMKEDKISVESAESLYNPVNRAEATAITREIESLTLMENGILKQIEYKDVKEEDYNDTEQLIILAVKQEQTEPEHIGEQSCSMTSLTTKKAKFEMQIAS